MTRLNTLLALGAIALLGAAGVHANDDDGRFRPVPQLSGVWMTQVTIRDCQTGTIVLAGPFAGLITFHAGGTVSESGPAPPNTARGPGHGTWHRTGRNTFAQALIFQRFDVTGIFLGTQVIHGVWQVADDSNTMKSIVGTFEVNDVHGSTIASGCSAVTGTRFD